MSVLTSSEIRQIADNPDGCDIDDLQSLADFIGSTDFRIAAEQIWNNDNLPEGYISGSRTPAARILRQYCLESIAGRKHRSAGRIDRAMQYEIFADHAYDQLPMWAKW